VANLTTISLKSCQLSKKTHWDFLSVFSDDFLLSTEIVVKNKFSGGANLRTI